MTIKGNSAKSIPLVLIAVAVVIVLVVVIVMVNKTGGENDGTTTNKYAEKAKSADDIEIKDSDSYEVKVEKMQGKIELINKEIDEKQAELDVENQKINKLYEEYVSVMNEYQTGVPAE